MKQRRLGDRLAVSEIGYGAWVLTGAYGESDEKQGIMAINHALDQGVTMIDTCDVYADGANEKLVGRAIAGRRDDVVVATRWGMVGPGEHASKLDNTFEMDVWIDARPARAREAAEASLRRLGVETIDLWYLHFPDPGRPIEETVGAMAELVQSGEVRHLGLSNHTADQLRRAHAIHPITAVQNEYSLATRGVESDLLPTARELGVGIVAWAPLGQGLLLGGVQLGDTDVRQIMPRFQGEDLQGNLDRFAPFRALAAEFELSPAQLALGWLLHQGEDIVPIPGTRSPEHIDANLVATEIELDQGMLTRIDELMPADIAIGEPLRVLT